MGFIMLFYAAFKNNLGAKEIVQEFRLRHFVLHISVLVFIPTISYGPV